VEAARLATEDDVPRLAALAAAARDELSPMKGGWVWRVREARPDPLADGFAAALRAGNTRVLAGTIDGVVIGYAVAHLEVLGEGSTLGVVDDIFVEEGARGVGVGEAMMADLLAWCTGQGCVGMDAMALPGHRSAKNFFEQNGFTARKIVMHRSFRA
jgi:GNAT superfamily N-acetyltransferase